MLVDSNAEAMPHLKEGHYFNLLNIFGVGSAKCQYSIVNPAPDSRKNSQKHSTSSNKFGEISQVFKKYSLMKDDKKRFFQNSERAPAANG